MIQTLSRLTQTRPIQSPMIQTLSHLTQTRPTQSPMTQTLPTQSPMNQTPPNQSLMIQLSQTLNRPRLNQMALSLTILSRSKRQRCSQYLPNKQKDKIERGSRGPKEIVSDENSMTPPINLPALTPIARCGTLAFVQLDIPARTPRVSAHMQRSVCLFGQTRQRGYGRLSL
jgi:hypothetical protein